MEVIDAVTGYNLQDVLNRLGSDERVLFLSNEDYFKNDRKVYTIKPHFDWSYTAGLVAGAIFIDRDSSHLYDLRFLEFIINRIRGDGSKKFPDKLYFITCRGKPETFTFY